jgi:hypothetical protein
MTRLDVAVVGCDADLESTELTALASLPSRFRVSTCADDDATCAATVAARFSATVAEVGDAVRADVLLVGATSIPPDDLVRWAEASAAKAVVLHRPGLDALDAFVRSCERLGLPVIVPSPLTDDPAWARARGWCADLGNGDVARLSFLLGGRDGEPSDVTQPAGRGERDRAADALVDACAVVFDALGAVDVERAVGVGRRGWDALLRAGQKPVLLTVSDLARGPSERRFEILAPAGQATIDFGSPALFGSPSMVRRHDIEGTTEATPICENGWRSSWRELHETIEKGEVPATPALARAALELAARIQAGAGR